MRRQHHTKPDFTPLTEARLIVFFTRQLTRQTAKSKNSDFISQTIAIHKVICYFCQIKHLTARAMKTITFLFLALVSSLGAYAYDFISSNIFYSVLSKQECTCEVTKRPRNSVRPNSEIVIIPEIISDDPTHGYRVTSVGSNAFDSCRISALVINRYVGSLKAGAFSVKGSIPDIFVVNSTPPQCDDAAFTAACYNKSTLHVPQGYSAAYRSAPGWQKFSHVIEDQLDVNDPEPNKFLKDKIVYSITTYYLKTAKGDSICSTCTADRCIEGGDVVIPDPVINPYNNKPYPLQYINDFVFSNVKLTSVVFPKSVKSVASWVFNGQNDLEMIVIPEEQYDLKDLFNFKPNLRRVYARSPSPYKYAVYDDNYPYFYRTNLTSKMVLNVPIGCAKNYEKDRCWQVFGRIRERDFSADEKPDEEFTSGDLKFRVMSEHEQKCSVIRNNDVTYSGHLTIPCEVEHNGIPYYVVDIDDNAFSGYSQLTSVTLPVTLCNIGDSAFFCSGLAGDLRIPDNTRSVGSYAFAGCTGLKNIHIGRNTRIFNAGAFVSVTKGDKEYKMDIDTIFSDYCMNPSFLLDDPTLPFNPDECKVVVVPPEMKGAYLYSGYNWSPFFNKMICSVEQNFFTNHKVTLAVNDGTLSVTGNFNADIEVFNSLGQLVYSGRSRHIKLPQRGIYVVRIAGDSAKITF